MKKQYLCPQTEGCEVKAMVNLLAGSSDYRKVVGGPFDDTPIIPGNPGSGM